MAAKKSKDDADFTVDWVVIQPVKHNGEDYQVGEAIALTEKESTLLLELGVIGAGASEVSIQSETGETPPESEIE